MCNSAETFSLSATLAPQRDFKQLLFMFCFFISHYRKSKSRWDEWLPVFLKHTDWETFLRSHSTCRPFNFTEHCMFVQTFNRATILFLNDGWMYYSVKDLIKLWTFWMRCAVAGFRDLDDENLSERFLCRCSRRLISAVFCTQQDAVWHERLV